jgi:anti-sigma factor RsiW
MTSPDHVGELAELYALGTLDDRERALVDAHVLTCDACAARVGEAEAAVVRLVDERSPSPALDRRMRGTFARPAAWRWTAPLVAAAFVLGLLPSIAMWSGTFGGNAFSSDQQQAVRAMVGSHFLHAPFVALTGDAPKAKVIYGRTGDWRFVVAQTARPYDVAVVFNGQTVSLGKLHVSGNAAELFIAHAPPAPQFVLRDGTRIVAHVTLPYRP